MTSGELKMIMWDEGGVNGEARVGSPESDHVASSINLQVLCRLTAGSVFRLLSFRASIWNSLFSLLGTRR